jgi:hypothetical protein
MSFFAKHNLKENKKIKMWKLVLTKISKGENFGTYTCISHLIEICLDDR